MRRHTQPGHMIYDTAWMVSVSMVTCFLQIALTMSSVAMVADENMYAGLFFMRNIKNWIISVSMVTSEYRRGKRALYFAIDPCLYLKEHENTTRKKQKGRGGGWLSGSSVDIIQNPDFAISGRWGGEERLINPNLCPFHFSVFVFIWFIHTHLCVFLQYGQL